MQTKGYRFYKDNAPWPQIVCNCLFQCWPHVWTHLQPVASAAWGNEFSLQAALSAAFLPGIVQEVTRCPEQKGFSASCLLLRSPGASAAAWDVCDGRDWEQGGGKPLYSSPFHRPEKMGPRSMEENGDAGGVLRWWVGGEGRDLRIHSEASFVFSLGRFGAHPELFCLM